MRISDYIRQIFRRGDVVLRQNNTIINNIFEPRMHFGDVVFLNMVELLTDLATEITWVAKGDVDTVLFAEFRYFYDRMGKNILTKLYYNGYVVIGYKNGFRLLAETEYIAQTTANAVVVTARDADVQVFVMRTSTYDLWQKSDKQMVQPYIEFLDNVLNASNTVSARLGSVVVASPKNLTNAPTSVVLTREQKDELERETQDEYGALDRQKLFMVLPREMVFQVINLAGLDQRTNDKARLAILAIADRIKVPANQIAMIDANSSKSLSNGSELREGDYNKYQSFERLLNGTFLRLADSVGLKLTYTMDNKPKREMEVIG